MQIDNCIVHVIANFSKPSLFKSNANTRNMPKACLHIIQAIHFGTAIDVPDIDT